MSLTGCMKCGGSRDEGRYASRGLCGSCYGKERRAGTLSSWSNHSATAFRGSNPTLQACMLVGATKVSELLGVPKDVVRKWAREGTPSNKEKKVSALKDSLLSMECSESATAERASLFGDKEQNTADPWAVRASNAFPGWGPSE